MGEKYKGSFELPMKEVRVEFIPRKRGMAAGDHITKDHLISGGMLDNAVNKYMVPLKRNGGGGLVNVLNNDEKAFLEDKLGVDLSIYGDYWTNQSVSLTKQPTIFDLQNPSDYIQIAILKANKKEIVEGYSHRNDRVSYKYMIIEDGEKLASDKKTFDVTKKAWKEYMRIEDQKDILMGILRLVDNKPISDSSALDWVQGKIEGMIVATPEKFLNIIKDESFETRVLIQTAVAKGVVERRGNKYSTVDGLDLAWEGEVPTFEIAVRYLDHDKNQAVRDTLAARIHEIDHGPAKKRAVKKTK